jgi:fido (protein-threonine AMPylation protein)
MALLDDIIAKKKTLDAARPLNVDVVRNLAGWFEMELTIAGLGLEGCVFSHEEIAQVRTRGPVLRSRPPSEQKLALNHLAALQLVARLSFQQNGVVTERTVGALHGTLYHGLLPTAGKYRDASLVKGHRGLLNGAPDPAKVRVSMSALSGWLRRTEPSLETALEAHHRLLSARPFEDGNAAVSLLLANLVFNLAGYPPVVVSPAGQEQYFATSERGWVAGDKAAFRDFMLGLMDQSLDVCLVGAAQALAGQSDA